MNKGMISRRSVLQLAGVGAGATLLGSAVTHSAFAASADVEKAVNWAKTALPNSTPEIIEAAAKEGKLSLLLLHYAGDSANTAMVKKFNEHYPFIDVSYTLQHTSQLESKFNAQLNAKRGIDDYVHLAPGEIAADNYMKQGALTKFVISQASAFPAASRHDGMWYPWHVDYGATVYRADALSTEEKQLVRSYKGLGDPRFKGRIGLNGITNSATQAGVYVLLYETDKSIWDGLVANKPHVTPSSASLINGLLGGEYDVGLMSGFGSAANAVKQGAPVEFGVTAPSALMYSSGAISALAPNPNAAKLWQDWVMSQEGQDLWAKVSGTISARTDVSSSWAMQQPWFFNDRSTNKDINWSDFAAKQTQMVDRFKKDMQAG